MYAISSPTTHQPLLRSVCPKLADTAGHRVRACKQDDAQRYPLGAVLTIYYAVLTRALFADVITP